jgi:hypothetical protein
MVAEITISRERSPLIMLRIIVIPCISRRLRGNLVSLGISQKNTAK